MANLITKSEEPLTTCSFTFDDDGHAYRDESGAFIPSLTQILRLQGLSLYDSKIPRSVLEAKAKIGSDVHQICESIDLYGEYDPGWITAENEPYVRAYETFLRTSGFIPDPAWVERQWIASIGGRRFGLKIDCRGKLNGHDAILERKCSEAVQEYWGYQTAAQEMAALGTTRCGRIERLSIRLQKNGKPRLEPFTHHENDSYQFLCALANVHERLSLNQKLWEEL